MCHTVVDDTGYVGQCDQCHQVKTLVIEHSCATTACCGIGLCADCITGLHLEDIVKELQDRGQGKVAC